MADKKEKRYVSDDARLMAEWDWEKNNELKLYPETLTLGSGKKVWWKCSKGHEWESPIYRKSGGGGCPYCSNKKVLIGYNDLQTINPELSKEWDFQKNDGVMPTDVVPYSNKKIWWKCSKGHEWQSTIANRTQGYGCPYCAGQRPITGYNDLQTVNPILAKEWNYEKNNGLTPMDVLPNSGKKAWWKCNKGHEWLATIESRNYGRGCPFCSSERNTSLPEYILLYYLKKYGMEAIHTYNLQGCELDIYIPSKRIAIEYDGYYWHKNKLDKDLYKNAVCRKNGIKLYRIRESLLSLNDSSIDYVIRKDRKDLPETFEKILFEIIGFDIDIDLERDIICIESMREYLEKDNSIVFSNSKIASEWNYERNGTMRPEHFLANSNKTVWWKCREGHEWRAKIHSRNEGNGCPYCSGKYVVKGKTDLQTLNPSLAKEWNYEKNDGLTPVDVLSKSGKKVWWKCSKGHEWQTSIYARNNGSGCPYCSGKYVVKGKTDLQTVRPALAKEWDYEKNCGLTPRDVLPNSGKKVWWKCKNGHMWQATINHRGNGEGCPYCSGKYVVKGKTDLQTLNPSLAKEWNYEKNDGLTPMDVSPKSGKKVWWKCSKGHEWQSTIINRSKSKGCPYCNGVYVLKGENDLLTLNPTIAKEWNYEKNDGLMPWQVFPNSNKKVWWKCSEGHEWQAIISNRTKGFGGCHKCAKQKRKVSETTK